MDSARKIWVVRAGTGGRYSQEYEHAGAVAIGWGQIGDASSKTREELRALIEERIPETNALSSSGQVFRFVNEIQIGDIMITPDGSTRELLLGEVVGPYEFTTEGVGHETYRHTHRVRWQGRKSRDLLPQRVLYSLGSVLTVFQPRGRQELLALYEGETAIPDSLGEDDVEVAAGEDLVADLQARSGELVDAAIARLDAYDTQNLVAGLLKAMGYHTVVSPPGADQGIDIVASRDPLGLEGRVKVQVKARPNSRSGAPEVVQLAGNVSTGERGMFVSTGGFTREAETHPAAHAIARVDGQALRGLVIEYYERLDSDTKALLPLRRMYFPDD